MPNWCYTIIKLYNTPEKITALDKALQEAQKEWRVKSDFGSMWLGNLLVHMGYSKDEVVNGDIRCRGSITDISVSKEEINLATETAWSPMLQVIRLFADKFAPDTEITYTAEEPGCELYWTNDPDYEGTYYADGYLDGEYEHLYELTDCSPNTVARTLEDELKLPKTEDESDKYIQELCKRLNEKMEVEDPDLYLTLNQYQYVELSDCD